MKNHVSDFYDFYFSSYGENSSKIANFEYKNDHILKTLDRKNLKINFSFVTAQSTSFILMIFLIFMHVISCMQNTEELFMNLTQTITSKGQGPQSKPCGVQGRSHEGEDFKAPNHFFKIINYKKNYIN